MTRSLLSLLLVLALGADALAQTTPARSSATRRPASKAAAAPSKAPKTRVSAPAVAEEASGKGQNVYAAPGMPVNVDNPKKVGSYDGDAARRKNGTTLSPK